ncbi:hypothetical protein [Arsenicicoccus bolidensis]|uniref:hypothetical protein n=1 Tax=Arsenicicoccus bolidensis TaxID=229480 RepID=UPI0028AFA043|nr:hypothetical protein [Arsenicicoccus bolidensis]
MPDRHMRFTIDDEATVTLIGGREGEDVWPCMSQAVAEKVALRHATRTASADDDQIHVSLETPDGEKVFIVTGQETEQVSKTSADDHHTDEEATATRPKANRITPNAQQTPRPSTLEHMMQAGASKVRSGSSTPRSIIDTVRDMPLASKIGAGLVVFLLVATLVSLPFRGGEGEPANASTESATAALPDGCLGGQDVLAAAKAAGPLASSSTIQQNGLTVPAPSGAAAAAAAYARLRSTLPVPTGRDQAIAAVLAPDATAAAKQGIPAAAGWVTHLDMSKARWRVVSGDGQSAGIDLLLTSVGTQNGKAADPTQIAVHVDLVRVDGQWRLKDVGAPKDTNALATAHTFKNVEACS